MCSSKATLWMNLPPGMASKINTKGKRVCIPLLYFGVAEIGEGVAFDLFLSFLRSFI